MEQAWNFFFTQVRWLFEAAASPFIYVAGKVGIELNAGQVWMLSCALLFAGYATHLLHGDWVLARRGRRTVGTIVGIDPGDESPDRPLIEFRDQLGRLVVFTSHLGVNATTKAIGAQVEIIFDPVHPKRAREVGRAWAKASHLLTLAVFVGFLALATVMMRDAIY